MATTQMPDQVMRAEDELGTDSLHDSTVRGGGRIVEFFGGSETEPPESARFGSIFTGAECNPAKVP
jgi:hypothetical protein